MGRYGNLNDPEKILIPKLANASRVQYVTTWVLASAKSGSALRPLDGEGSEEITDVSGSEAFYTGLREKGFVTLGWSSSGSLQVCIQQAAIDYLRYANKTRLGRWLEDCGYDLVHERTVWAKLAWLVLGYALGFASAILLRALGWIRVGN